jgi:hypothetical protein
MRSRAAARFALAVAIADAIGACHRRPVDDVAVAVDAAAVAPPDAEAALLPARCRKTDVAFVLDDGHGLADLEIGDGLAYPGGYAVGLVHRTSAGRVAAIAMLRRDPIGLTRLVDLGPTMGDAPSPRVGWRSGELVAAAYVRPLETKATAPSQGAQGAQVARGDATRDVALYSVADGAEGVSSAPLSVPQRRDDSLALDLAFAGPAGLLVWDEATSGPRGVVKAAAFTRDRAAAARDVSPPDSDAELPRVVSAGSGFAVIWIARRAEPGSALDGAAAEATGEARAYGWLEMVAVDSQGAATGPVRRLTPPGGHVSAYDVEARDGAASAVGGAGSILLVVARDDGEAVDGSGGALLRVRVTGEGAEPPVSFASFASFASSPALAAEGLGRGAPSFISASARGSSIPSPWSSTPSPALALAWVATGEQARLLPLDSTGVPAGPPSAEDGFDDARALLFMGGGPRPRESVEGAPTVNVLVATPSDSAAQLRVFRCAR